jgi:hypothetical protein
MGDTKSFIIFSQNFNEKENNILYRLVTKEELMFALCTFHKYKIPNPNGWNAIFFIELFDVLGDDLLIFF